MFLRGDFGIDVNLDSADGTDPDNMFHLGGGVGGWVSPEFALMGELMITDTGDNIGNNVGQVTTMSASGRYMAGSVAPYFSLVLPLDNDINDAIDFGIVLGLDAQL
jgi:hypothetical protein